MEREDARKYQNAIARNTKLIVGYLRAKTGKPVAARKAWWNPFSWWPSDDIPDEADVQQAVDSIIDEERDPDGSLTEDAIREAGERTKEPILQMIADLEQQLEEATGPENQYLRSKIRDQIRRAQDRLAFIDTLTAKRLAMRGRIAS